MALRLRVEYPGGVYHLMNRGDRREPIFKDDADRELFLQTFTEACTRTGWRVHVYVLMPNHFHLVMETPGANLVSGMKWFLGTYTSRWLLETAHPPARPCWLSVAHREIRCGSDPTQRCADGCSRDGGKAGNRSGFEPRVV